MVNIYQIFDPLPVSPGNEQDLGHENIVRVHDMYVLETSLLMEKSHGTFLPKTGVSICFCQRFGSDLIMMQLPSKTPVLSRKV